ncbi:hypothetical protein V2J09_019567 [Rumex salicifolius]
MIWLEEKNVIRSFLYWEKDRGNARKNSAVNVLVAAIYFVDSERAGHRYLTNPMRYHSRRLADDDVTNGGIEHNNTSAESQLGHPFRGLVSKKGRVTGGGGAGDGVGMERRRGEPMRRVMFLDCWGLS